MTSLSAGCSAHQQNFHSLCREENPPCALSQTPFRDLWIRHAAPKKEIFWTARWAFCSDRARKEAQKAVCQRRAGGRGKDFCVVCGAAGGKKALRVHLRRRARFVSIHLHRQHLSPESVHTGPVIRLMQLRWPINNSWAAHSQKGNA